MDVWTCRSGWAKRKRQVLAWFKVEYNGVFLKRCWGSGRKREGKQKLVRDYSSVTVDHLDPTKGVHHDTQPRSCSKMMVHRGSPQPAQADAPMRAKQTGGSCSIFVCCAVVVVVQLCMVVVCASWWSGSVQDMQSQG